MPKKNIFENYAQTLKLELHKDPANEVDLYVQTRTAWSQINRMRKKTLKNQSSKP